MMNDSQRHQDRAARTKAALVAAGLPVMPSETHVVPVVVGGIVVVAALAASAAGALAGVTITLPGRARLATKPLATGSLSRSIAITGMLVVAWAAACTAAG